MYDVHVVSFTNLDTSGFRGLKSFCAEHNLDPKTPVAFARFWKSLGYDPTLFLHLGITVNVSVNSLCEPYGLLVTQPAQTQWFVYGSLAFWGHFFNRQKDSFLAKAVLSKLKGLGFYELLS